MKRKQVAAILLSAIMAVSACVPMNGISAVAAEKVGTESTGTSQVVEEPDEEEAPAPEADMPEEDSSGAEESEAELPEAAASEAEETEEEEPAANNTAGEEAGTPSAQQEADAPEAAQPEAATQDAPEAAQQEAAAQDAQEEQAAQDAPEAAQEEQATRDAPEASQEESAATEAEDHTAQLIEEEAREETGRPALRALQPEDFENAEEIYAGDEKNGDAFGDDYAVWEFTPDESGSYLFSTNSSLAVFLTIYDADYHKIADDGREWDSIERYFYMGMTYYLAAELAHPKDEDDYISISLKQLEMPDLYVEGNEQSVIRVPYGEEAVLSVFAISSTGELYYRWEDESDEIVGTSDSYTFTPERNTTVICRISDGPDEETARSEYRVFDVRIENHLSVRADGEYEPYSGGLIKSVGFGDPVTLKVTASADDDSRLTYVWTREEVSMVEDEDGGLVPWSEYVEIKGENTNTYEIESAEESGKYHCTVTDRFGNRWSLCFDLRVSNLSSAYPEGAKEGDEDAYVSADYGSALTLRVIVKAADPGKVKFCWDRVEQKANGSGTTWNRIPGADTAEYEIKSVKAKQRYHCNVSDGAKEFDLDFYVSLKNPLRVKAEGAKENESNTARLYAAAGSSLTLRAIVSAPEDSQLKYKWSSCEIETDEWGETSYGKFVTIKGADKAAYRIAKAEERVYKCTVSDQNGNSAKALFYVFTENRLHAYPEGTSQDESELFLEVDPTKVPTLHVIATAVDDSQISYQWQKKADGSGDDGDEEYGGEDPIDDGDGDDGRYEDIEGANGDSYLPDLLEGMDYRCVVSDQYGNSARVYYYLSVENGLRAYPEGAEEGSDTVDIYIGLGDTVTLKVKAEALDDSCLTYRWSDYDGTQYETDRDAFVIKEAEKSKEYRCEVLDQYGNSYTAYFNVVIENHLVAYPEGSEPDTDGLDKPVPPLTPVSLKVVVQADDTNGLTYEWREQREDEDVQTIEGADTDTYTIASVDHESHYTCVVRDRYNNKKFITFHVQADNKLTAYPKGAGEGEDYVFLYVGYGKPVTLRTIVSALYEDGITYEWYSDYFDVIEGASGKEFRVSSVTETAWYYCRVYDKFGNWVEVRFVLNVENHLKAYPEGYEGHDTTTIYAKPGSKVKLSAIVEADDQEGLTTTWRKRDDLYETFSREGKTITVNAEDEEYVFTAEDKYGNKERVSYIIKLSEDIPAVDISKATVTVKDDVYNGTERKPAVRVVYEGRVLTKGTDYTLSYKNNVKAGIRTAKAIVTGDNVTLSGKKEEAFSILPGKTARGDMFNLAGNVKVTWKAVPGAKYYKVYREGVTDASESVSEPVIVTSLLVGWDKSPGLVNGHAYRYRIVASLTGGSKSSGDSTQSYSKLMYRLKTVAIKRVKNTEPGKVKVWFDKTTSGDSYVLQYGEREDMVDAKTKVVQGAENTSYTIGGLKKGKTYYISIRVRKKVDGVFYYTTFGVAKKVRIEQ